MQDSWSLHPVIVDLETPAPLILCLSGGGFRGYYTALVLAKIEEMAGAKCNQIFDLIAGTSVGGIVALGLAHGVPANEIAAGIVSHGQEIFPKLRFILLRRIYGPPYKTESLRNVIRSILGASAQDQLLACGTNVMVVTVALSTARLSTLRSWDHNGTATVSTEDAALATSAAPTYFPAVRVTEGMRGLSYELVDGGIAANAPDALAIHHAVTELGFAEDRIMLVSIGTCAPQEGASAGMRAAKFGIAGAMSKMGGRGIINLMMAVQERRGITEAQARLGLNRYLRIDSPASAEQAKCLLLDNASAMAHATLSDLANSTYERLRTDSSHPVWRAMLAKAQSTR
jgi:patatin-like phospholipase/acyl hydrolase